MIEEPAGIGPADIDLPHVTHIEEAGVAAHCLVLLEDAAILHRHLPAGEIHHPPPVGDVKIAKGRAFEVTQPVNVSGRPGGRARKFSRAGHPQCCSDR